jgi:hypothetical protein
MIIEVRNLLPSFTVIMKFNCSGHLRKPEKCSAFFVLADIFILSLIYFVFQSISFSLYIKPLYGDCFSGHYYIQLVHNFVVYIILFNWFIRNCKLSSFEYHLVMFSNTFSL